MADKAPSAHMVLRKLPESALIPLVTAILYIGPAAAVSDRQPYGSLASSKASAIHRIVVLVDSDDAKKMGHAISYSVNITKFFASKGEKVLIEIVANGSGIKLFRADTSPLQQPLAALRVMIPSITYSVCNSSKMIMEQREGHSIPIINGARLVPFGIGRVIELEEAGWSYVNG
jgi:uncharacterized protein